MLLHAIGGPQGSLQGDPAALLPMRQVAVLGGPRAQA